MEFVPLPRPKLWKNKADFFRPFRIAAASAGENIAPLYDPALHREIEDEPNLRELNAALAVLIDVFPDVEPEVFREMLLSISDESRLQVVTEHLLTKQARWVRGRYRKPTTAKVKIFSDPAIVTVSEDEAFRSDSYRKAVKQVLYQEFKTLSHSSIRAVLAEQNFSYTLARPILQQLSIKSWRFSLSNLWPRKSTATVASEHAFLTMQTNISPSGRLLPAVRSTGSAQLDRELYDLYVAPALQADRQEQLSGDYQLALKLNEEEAEQLDALFECECCYSSVAFERISACDDGCHVLCFECVKRTVNEALFGQGWGRNVDLERSSVKCFASTECQGVLSPEIVRRALSGGGDNDDAWNEFQQRAATDVMSKSQLSLQRCPFCTYAEVNEPPPLRLRPIMDLAWYVATHLLDPIQLLLSTFVGMLLIFTIPTIALIVIIRITLQISPSARAIVPASWVRVYQKRLGMKFRCLNPSCSSVSCTICYSRWQDPHTCFEKEQTSLRTAIESSATAAVKRTCPRCLLSFIKSSGCNKMVCNCGYTMCYICRQEITAGEGYTHFCQHFRVHGGRCTECERCDLYGDEDEEAAIRSAAVAAEKAWKEREGSSAGATDGKSTQAMVEALVGRGKQRKAWEVWLDDLVNVLAADVV